jgi:TIR domain
MKEVNVFISYAHEDLEAARNIYSLLAVSPYVMPWLDKECLQPGQKWERAIRQQIRKSQFFILILSSNSVNKRGFYQKEIKIALDVLAEFPDDQVFILPVRLDDCGIVSEPLREIQYVDMFPDWNSGAARLTDVIAECANPAEVPSTDIFRESLSCVYSRGSDLNLKSGISGTRSSPNGHLQAWFPTDDTVILGDSNINPPYNPDSETIAQWNIQIPPSDLNRIDKCYLSIGCIRHFGGLHSPTSGDLVQIFVNDEAIDAFFLLSKPHHQNDFFHYGPHTPASQVKPFTTCQNVYSWIVPVGLLRHSGSQSVEVRLAKRAKWDIDLIGFVYSMSDA